MENVADIIPVDLPVNVMIAAAWHKVVKKPKDTLIFNVTSGSVSPITWGDMGMEIFEICGRLFIFVFF